MKKATKIGLAIYIALLVIFTILAIHGYYTDKYVTIIPTNATIKCHNTNATLHEIINGKAIIIDQHNNVHTVDITTIHSITNLFGYSLTAAILTLIFGAVILVIINED